MKRWDNRVFMSFIWKTQDEKKVGDDTAPVELGERPSEPVPQDVESDHEVSQEVSGSFQGRLDDALVELGMRFDCLHWKGPMMPDRASMLRRVGAWNRPRILHWALMVRQP
jgi:hypothetical protein